MDQDDIDYGDQEMYVGDSYPLRKTTSARANTSAKVDTAGKPMPANDKLRVQERTGNSVSSDSLANRSHISEPTSVPRQPTGPRLPRRQVELKRRLRERHVNMIALSSVLGVGLYLQNGRVIYLAGPGMAFLIYIIGASMMWSVMGCLGEMTALFPVPGALFELPARFLDRSIGYTAGCMAWFSWVVIIAAELDAVATLFKFEFQPNYLKAVGYPKSSLRWNTIDDNPALWVAPFWILSLGINMLPIWLYGEIEWLIGVLKLLFFVGLIIFQFVLHLQLGTGDRFYRSPYNFVTESFTTWQGITHYDAGWRVAGVWTGFVVAIYSLIGFEAVSITAAENKDIDSASHNLEFIEKEGIKISTRKIAIRILLLYSLSTLIVSFNVPGDDPMIVNSSVQALSGGAHSTFIIAAVRAHKLFWPSFMNAMFILSATSASINSLYLSSRLLHAFALAQPAWPDFWWTESVREWLSQVKRPGFFEGVPHNAVFISSLFGLLGFLACASGPEQVLGRLAINSSISMLIAYCVVCGTYIKFQGILARAAKSSFPRTADRDRQPDPQAFDRGSDWTYPYKSSWQPFRAYCAGTGCLITILFNGWQTFSPFKAADFFASYVSIIVFLVICLTYRIRFLKSEGWRAVFTELSPALDMRNPIKVHRSEDNPGRNSLQIDADNIWSWKNVESLGKWIIIWVKP